MPAELNFQLRRLSVLQALRNADLAEAQRSTATLLGPLADSNSDLRPMLQQTMQWFLQTEQSEVQSILQSEASAASQALNTRFSRLCGPTKRSAPDSVVDPPPPNSVQPRGDDATCAGASTSAGGGAASCSRAHAAAASDRPSTSTAAVITGPEGHAAADAEASANGEDAESSAARSCRLVNLLQAGVFVYASWLCRVPPVRRRDAATDPCGRVLGMHSLLHGGIDAAMAVMQALDGGERGTAATGEPPSGATRSMSPDWGTLLYLLTRKFTSVPCMFVPPAASGIQNFTCSRVLQSFGRFRICCNLHWSLKVCIMKWCWTTNCESLVCIVMAAVWYSTALITRTGAQPAAAPPALVRLSSRAIHRPLPRPSSACSRRHGPCRRRIRAHRCGSTRYPPHPGRRCTKPGCARPRQPERSQRHAAAARVDAVGRRALQWRWHQCCEWWRCPRNSFRVLSGE